MDDCLFCKIIEEDMPSAKIYEDKDTFAFLDINPVNPGHTLVVPKKHYRNIFDIPEETLCDMIQTAKKLAKAVKEATGSDGINIGISNEKAAGQEIFHIHIHIIPRFQGDGFKHWPGTPYKEGVAETIAGKIRSELT